MTFAPSAKAAHYTFVTLVFPPLEYADKDGNAKGIAVDIVKRVMKELGHTVTIKVYPWIRSINMTKSGGADGIFTAYKNPEREEFLDYSDEVLIDQKVSFYVKKNSHLKFDGDFTKLRGKSIGILNTVSYGMDFDRAKDTVPLKTQRVEELELNFKKLSAGRVDYVVSNGYSAATIIKELKMGHEIIELPQPVEVIPSYIAFSKKKKLTQLRNDFDRVLKKLKESGWYEKALSQTTDTIKK